MHCTVQVRNCLFTIKMLATPHNTQSCELNTTNKLPTVKHGMDCGTNSFHGIILKVVASCMANNMGVASLTHTVS